MKNMAQEFKDFINRGNLLDLAIGLVLALFFVQVIQAIVDGVVMNLIAAIFGQPNFDSITITVRTFDDGTTADLLIGSVITTLVMFLIVAFICFLIVKAYNRMKKPAVEEAGPTEVELLTEIRDSLRQR